MEILCTKGIFLPSRVVYLYLIDPLKLPLLTDAEVDEDVVEDGVADDLVASDFAEGADREAKDDWTI